MKAASLFTPTPQANWSCALVCGFLCIVMHAVWMLIYVSFLARETNWDFIRTHMDWITSTNSYASLMASSVIIGDANNIKNSAIEIVTPSFWMMSSLTDFNTTTQTSFAINHVPMWTFVHRTGIRLGNMSSFGIAASGVSLFGARFPPEAQLGVALNLPTNMPDVLQLRFPTADNFTLAAINGTWHLRHNTASIKMPPGHMCVNTCSSIPGNAALFVNGTLTVRGNVFIRASVAHKEPVVLSSSQGFPLLAMKRAQEVAKQVLLLR